MQFNFYRLKVTNAENCNLTEIDAAGQFAQGSIWHPDTIAHVVRYNYAMQFIERLPAGAKVLDLGCGEFQLLRFLQVNQCAWPRDCEYWGYDVRAKHAWHKHLINGPKTVNLVRQSALAPLEPGFPKEYDLVICYEMFEHIPVVRQENFIRIMSERTKFGGIVLFSTPNGGQRRIPVANHTGPDGDREPRYAYKVAAVKRYFDLIEEFGTGCRTDHLKNEARTGLCRRARKFLPLSLYLGFVSVDHPKEANGSTFLLKKKTPYDHIRSDDRFVQQYAETISRSCYIKVNARQIPVLFSLQTMFVDMDGQHTFEKLDEMCRRLGWRCRAYRTNAGWRLIEMGSKRRVSLKMLKLLKSNGVDQRYLKICENSAWRARLSPKARRIGFKGDKWNWADYNVEQRKYATCRFMGMMGDDRIGVEPDAVKVANLHDMITHAFTPLPLR